MALLEQREQARRNRRTTPDRMTMPSTSAQLPRHSRNVRLETTIVLALIAIALVRQLVLALAYPPFEGHDEVAHLAYLETLATEGRIPTFSDTISPDLEAFSRFTLDWPALYTANHPPLYYVTSLPAYLLAGDDDLARLYAVRLMSIPWFLLTIWLTSLIARILFPLNRLVTVGAPAVVAFQPQLGFEGAIVNNDMLAVMLGTLLLYLSLRAVRDGLTTRLALALGLTCGLGLLAKATLMALLPVVALACVWSRWPRPWSCVRDSDWIRGTAIRAAAVIGPTVALAAPWYFYLRRTYGDFTAFEATQELQSDWNRPAGTFTELLFSASFHKERIHETWGYFGWRLIPLESSQLAVIYVMMALSAVGIAVGVTRWLQRSGSAGVMTRLTTPQTLGIGILTTATVLMYGAMIYFGTMFLLTQARYFFPILPAAIILAVAGLSSLVPVARRRAATTLLVAGAGLFQLVIFVKLVVPYAYL